MADLRGPLGRIAEVSLTGLLEEGSLTVAVTTSASMLLSKILTDIFEYALQPTLEQG